jgi:hypothetical protein
VTAAQKKVQVWVSHLILAVNLDTQDDVKMLVLQAVQLGAVLVAQLHLERRHCRAEQVIHVGVQRVVGREGNEVAGRSRHRKSRDNCGARVARRVVGAVSHPGQRDGQLGHFVNRCSPGRDVRRSDAGPSRGAEGRCRPTEDALYGGALATGSEDDARLPRTRAERVLRSKLASHVLAWRDGKARKEI